MTTDPRCVSTETEPKFVAVIHFASENVKEDGSAFERWTNMLPLHGSETIEEIWKHVERDWLDRIEIKKAEPMLPRPAKEAP